MISRRRFNQGAVAMALAGLSRHLYAASNSSLASQSVGYGKLVDDPNGLLDLPHGFSYHVISERDRIMADGLPVPDCADGMGCLPIDNDRVALIRNHENSSGAGVAFKDDKQAIANTSPWAYDTDENGIALPGGTSTIIYNVKTEQVEREFMSLIGTVRNCSGGITPWNSWLTCEESVLTPTDKNKREHGYVFEVPATSQTLVPPQPIKAMGRFNHEAACVDPRTGIVYMTEDRNDSLLYRYIPNVKGNLAEGGQLQALAVVGQPQLDTRNWESRQISVGESVRTTWVNLTHVESPDDDLRIRGYQSGAALFARGEGIHWADDALYFCCTSGGKKKLGQIMRYTPSEKEGLDDEALAPGTLSLFIESQSKASFNYGDNLTVAPDGHLIVCEDQYTTIVDNHLKGVTPEGKTFDLARVNIQTEPAGACFSPDGSTLFVNLYSPAKTLAIKGPWKHLG